MSRIVSFAALIVSLVACGGGGSENPDATPDMDAPSSTASPDGGVYRTPPTVTITTDEPATIYYTTDGSEPTTSSASGESPAEVELTGAATLRFFAVDTAGNTEATAHEIEYTIDRLGPAAVDGFNANGVQSVELDWITPTAEGFARVVVVETDDVAATVPADGATLAVDDLVGAGVVVYTGSDSSFVHLSAGPGSHTYVAWAQYDNGTFSEGRTAAAFVDVAQTGQLTIDVGTAGVVIGTQPANVAIAASAVVFDAASSTVSVDVTLTSSFHGLVFNPKLVITVLSEGTVANGDGVVAADPYRFFGPEALRDGAPATRTLQVSGVTATSVITMDVAVQHDPGLYTSLWLPSGAGTRLSDLGTATSVGALPHPAGFDNPTRTDDYTQLRGAVVSPDGRYLYAGGRNIAQVLKIDLTTGTVIAGAALTLAHTTGSISDLALDPSGRRLYAAFNDGFHTGNSRRVIDDFTGRLDRPLEDNDVYLVEIDAATMTERGRVALGTGDAFYLSRRIGVSRDFRWAAVPIGTGQVTTSVSVVRIVDLSAWAERDLDSGTPGIQGVDASGDDARPIAAAFDWTGRYVVVGDSKLAVNHDRVGVIDLSLAEPTLVFFDPDGDAATATSRAIAFVPDPDGTIWLLGEYTGLVNFTPSTGAFVTLGTDAHYDVGGGWYRGQLLGTGYYELSSFDTTTGARTVAASFGIDSTFGHGFAITPF